MRRVWGWCAKAAVALTESRGAVDGETSDSKQANESSKPDCKSQYTWLVDVSTWLSGLWGPDRRVLVDVSTILVSKLVHDPSEPRPLSLGVHIRRTSFLTAASVSHGPFLGLGLGALGAVIVGIRCKETTDVQVTEWTVTSGRLRDLLGAPLGLQNAE